LIQDILRNRNLCGNDNPPLPIGTPVSSRLSDQHAPTRQHQPTHAPLLSNRGEPFNHSRKFLPTRSVDRGNNTIFFLLLKIPPVCGSSAVNPPADFSQDALSCAVMRSHDKKYTMAALSKDLLETQHSTKSICGNYRLSGANIRNMAANLSWMVDTLAGIADILRPQDAGMIQQIAECLQHRVPLECRHLNRLPVPLSRDEKIQLVKAGVKTEDDFLEKVPSDFKGVISPQKAEQIIQKTCQRRQRNHDFWHREHKQRLDVLGFRFSEVEDIYKQKGRDLEAAIERLFATNFAGCTAVRITDQRQAEPDNLLTFPNGEKMTAQTTARDDNNSFVDSKKAGDVIPQSARFHPNGFICFGRPDFQQLAQEQARHQAVEHNFKLIPIFVLA